MRSTPSLLPYLLLPGLCLAEPAYVEVSSSCFQTFQDPQNASIKRKLCVQPLECPSANISHARIITEEEVQTQQIPGGEVIFYSSGTAIVSCIECVRELCSLVNGTLPVIASQEDNQCVLGGGSVGTKARIPLAVSNLDNGGWDWPIIWGMATGNSHSYSNWAGNAPPSGIPSLNLCATMNKNGKWDSTPCDMTSYHTQKDYIVCSVPNYLLQDTGRDNADGLEPGKSKSSAGSTSGTNPIYYAIPVSVGVLVVAIILWRRSMDAEPAPAAENQTFAFYQEDGGGPLHVKEGAEGKTDSMDSNGYLLPQSREPESYTFDDNGEPTYYEATALQDGEDNEEAHYDMIGTSTGSEGSAQYDVATEDKTGSVVSNSPYVYGEENNAFPQYSTIERKGEGKKEEGGTFNTASGNVNSEVEA